MSKKLFVSTLVTGLATTALLAGGHDAQAAEETSPTTNDDLDNQAQPQPSNQSQTETPQTEGTATDKEEQPSESQPIETTTPEETQPTANEPQETPSTENPSDNEPSTQPEKPQSEEPLEKDDAPAEVSKEELKQQEIENAQNNLNTANQEVKTAQIEKEQALKEKNHADQALKAAQSVKSTSTKQINQQIDNETKKLDNTKSKVKATKEQVNQKSREIAEKENAINNYKPTVKETEVHVNHPVTEEERNKEAWSNSWVEDIQFDGEPRTETIKYTKGRYVPDIDKIGEYFVDYINEMKRINGLPGKVHLTDRQELKDFSAGRAIELADSFSHTTNLLHPEFMRSENIASMILESDAPYSDKEIAYKMALSWFSEYGNLRVNYGHRSNLLAANGEISIGIAEDKNTDYMGYDYYNVVYNSQSYDQEIDSSITEVENSNGVIEYKINGNKTKFLPKTTFRYVTEEVVDHSSDLKHKLDQLKKDKAALESRIGQYQNEISNIEKNIQDLKNQRQLIDASNEEKEKAIRDAKALVDRNNKALKEAEAKLANAMKNKEAAQKALEDLTRIDEPTKPTTNHQPPSTTPNENNPTQPTNPNETKPSVTPQPSETKPTPTQNQNETKPTEPKVTSTHNPSKTKPTSTQNPNESKASETKTSTPAKNDTKPTSQKTKAELITNGSNNKGSKAGQLKPIKNVPVENKSFIQVGNKTHQIPAKDVQVTLPTGEKVVVRKHVNKNHSQQNIKSTQKKNDDNVKLLPNTGQAERANIFAGIFALLTGMITLRVFRRKSM